MKKKPYFKLSWNGIEFRPCYHRTTGYFTEYNWWLYWWNWLPKHLRYLGYEQDWYDGPLSSFGLWFTNITWSLPWTSHDGTKSFSIRKGQKP